MDEIKIQLHTLASDPAADPVFSSIISDIKSFGQAAVSLCIVVSHPKVPSEKRLDGQFKFKSTLIARPGLPLLFQEELCTTVHC